MSYADHLQFKFTNTNAEHLNNHVHIKGWKGAVRSNNLICKGIPTGLREFLRYSGCDVDNYTTEDRNKKMAVLETIASKIRISSKVIKTCIRQCIYKWARLLGQTVNINGQMI